MIRTGAIRLRKGERYYLRWRVALPSGGVEESASIYDVLGREPLGKWELRDARTREKVYLFDNEIEYGEGPLPTRRTTRRRRR